MLSDFALLDNNNNNTTTTKTKTNNNCNCNNSNTQNFLRCHYLQRSTKNLENKLKSIIFLHNQRRANFIDKSKKMILTLGKKREIKSSVTRWLNYFSVFERLQQ